jgi:hypothetical protein
MKYFPQVGSSTTAPRPMPAQLIRLYGRYGLSTTLELTERP